MASIDVDWPEPQAPDQALGEFRAAQSRAIEKKGYRVTDMSPRSITYTRRFAWPKESFTVAASEDNGGAVVSVQGKIRPKLRKSLRELAKLRNTEFEHGSEDINGVPVLEPVPDPDPDPEPEPEESEVEEIYLDPGPDLEPAAQNGNESPLVREVRDAGLVAEGRQKRVEAEEQGDEIDCAEMEE